MQYLEQFVGTVSARRFLDQLIKNVSWRQEKIRLFGKEFATPRLSAWYGDRGLNYAYSGTAHVSDGWLPVLSKLRQTLRELLGVKFNFVLLNYYRTGNDSMGWHCDNEKVLGMNPLIASISLGAPRRFLVRPTETSKAGGASAARKSLGLELASGSLLLMMGDCQRRFEHALPKSKTCSTGRINVSFRNVNNSAALRTEPK